MSASEIQKSTRNHHSFTSLVTEVMWWRLLRLRSRGVLLRSCPTLGPFPSSTARRPSWLHSHRIRHSRHQVVGRRPTATSGASSGVYMRTTVGPSTTNAPRGIPVVSSTTTSIIRWTTCKIIVLLNAIYWHITYGRFKSQVLWRIILWHRGHDVSFNYYQ